MQIHHLALENVLNMKRVNMFSFWVFFGETTIGEFGRFEYNSLRYTFVAQTTFLHCRQHLLFCQGTLIVSWTLRQTKALRLKTHCLQWERSQRPYVFTCSPHPGGKDHTFYSIPHQSFSCIDYFFASRTALKKSNDKCNWHSGTIRSWRYLDGCSSTHIQSQVDSD